MPNRRSTRFAATLLLLALAWLTAWLLGGRGFAPDESVSRALSVATRPDLVAASRFVTHLGGWIVLSIVGVAAAIHLAFRRRRRAALLLIILFGGRLLVELQKLAFGRPRPDADGHLVAVSSMSFPSGHAANAMITYLAIALLLPVHTRYKAVAVAAALALTLLISLSRVALGVHWPSDLVGGWAFGLLWIMLMMRLASAREANA